MIVSLERTAKESDVQVWAAVFDHQPEPFPGVCQNPCSQPHAKRPDRILRSLRLRGDHWQTTTMAMLPRDRPRTKDGPNLILLGNNS